MNQPNAQHKPVAFLLGQEKPLHSLKRASDDFDHYAFVEIGMRIVGKDASHQGLKGLYFFIRDGRWPLITAANAGHTRCSDQFGSYNLGKFGEFGQVMCGYAVDDRPVNVLVVVYRDIPKTHCLLESMGQLFRDDTSKGQPIEGLAHGIRRLHAQIGNEMCAKIDAQLHGSGQIEGHNILKIWVPNELVRIGWALLRDALKATT